MYQPHTVAVVNMVHDTRELEPLVEEYNEVRACVLARGVCISRTPWRWSTWCTTRGSWSHWWRSTTRCVLVY